MAGKPAEPGHPERDSQVEPPRADERAGPVTIARHVKADGRALILYTRDTDRQT
jgi:hypothetical protein